MSDNVTVTIDIGHGGGGTGASEGALLSAGTIADVRSLEGTGDGDQVLVYGYTTSGDHGGVRYRFDEDSFAMDDAGMVLAPFTVGDGRWLIVAPKDGWYDARWFGVVADNSTDNATALERISAAEVRIQFPIGRSLTSTTWYPTRGFRGHGKDAVDTHGSSIKATSVWLGTDFLVDVLDLHTRNQLFAEIRLDANNKMLYSFGVSDLTHGGGDNVAAGFHRWDRVGFFGASSGGYPLYFPDTESASSMETVGGVFSQCFFNGNRGSGIMYLGVASDDVTFINCRLEHFNKPVVHPVRIHGLNVNFLTTYYHVGSDLGAGLPELTALFFLTSAGTSRSFRGLFIETTVRTATNWKHIFRFSGAPQVTISDVRLAGNPKFANDTTVAFAHINLGWPFGRVDFSNINQGFNSTMPNFLTVNTSGKGGNVTVRWHGGIDGFRNLVALDADSSQSDTGGDVAHFMGSFGGTQFDHQFSSDGATLKLTAVRQSSAEVTFAAGTAAISSAGAAAKLVAATVAKGDNKNFKVGTDNILTTQAGGFRRYRVQAMFLVDVASGTDYITLHVYSSGSSRFQTTAQQVTSGAPRLFEIDVILELDISKTIEIFAENEYTAENVNTAAFAERADTMPAHGYLRVTEV